MREAREGSIESVVGKLAAHSCKSASVDGEDALMQVCIHAAHLFGLAVNPEPAAEGCISGSKKKVAGATNSRE